MRPPQNLRDYAIRLDIVDVYIMWPCATVCSPQYESCQQVITLLVVMAIGGQSSLSVIIGHSWAFLADNYISSHDPKKE